MLLPCVGNGRSAMFPFVSWQMEYREGQYNEISSAEINLLRRFFFFLIFLFGGCDVICEGCSIKKVIIMRSDCISKRPISKVSHQYRGCVEQLLFSSCILY